jgi:hypothetical protein
MQKRNVQRVPDVLLTQCLLTRKKKRPNACFPSGASICKKKKKDPMLASLLVPPSVPFFYMSFQ